MSMNMIWDEAHFVVVDVEGNGARPPELVEVAVVPIQRGIIKEPRTWLIRPPTPISWQARKIHGISKDDVAEAPTVEEVAQEIQGALENAIPVGHGVHIDIKILRASLPDWEPALALDTLKLARRALNLPSYGLSALVEHFHLANGLPAGMRPHRADYDAIVTARLFVKLATNTPGVTLAALQRAGAMGSNQTSAGHSEATLFD